MVAFVTSGAVAALYVIVELTLRLRGNLVPVDDGLRIRSLEALGEVGGFLMVRAAGEMGFGSRLVAFVLPRILPGIRGTLGFILVFVLIPFLFRDFRLDGVQELGDWRIDAAKVRWVGAGIDCTFKFV